MASISKYLVSKTDLHIWVNADESPVLSGANILSLTDLSGNGRTMSCSATRPTLVSSVAAANDMPAIAFNGTTTQPAVNAAAVTVYDVFVVAAASGSTFGGEYRGLLSGPSGADPGLLVGETGGTKFTDFSVGQVYRSANTIYANANMVAPMSGSPKVIEMQFSGGLGLSNGLQIGKDRNFAARLWSGNVFEVLVYTRVLNDHERARIYQYFARKYQLWETSGGYDVFPATCEWGSSEIYGKRVIVDKAEDNTRYGRIKTEAKSRWDLSFNGRTPDEHLAVKQFYSEKYPLTQFVYRDRTLYPAVDYDVMFAPDAEIENVPGNHTGFSYKTKLEEV